MVTASVDMAEGKLSVLSATISYATLLTALYMATNSREHTFYETT